MIVIFYEVFTHPLTRRALYYSPLSHSVYIEVVNDLLSRIFIGNQ